MRRPLTSALLVLLVVCAAGCGSSNARTASSESAGAPAPKATTAAATESDDALTDPGVASTVTSAPLDQLVGQLIVTKLDGQQLSTAERRALESGRLGGVILFGYNATSAAQLRRFTRSIDAAGRTRALADAGPFIMADQEGGPTRAIGTLPPPVSQPRLGAAGSTAATRRQAALAARVLRRAGINVNLAPVADVDNGGAHVMRDRSFSSNPTVVADHITAAVRGFQTGDLVAATAKHFPGLGAATKNTDEGVSVDRRALPQLDADLAPFRAAIAAGADFVMTSHAMYPARGTKPAVPGTLDSAIVTDLLRDELGFRGVTISDSMNARGLREGARTTVPQACVRALAAGVDVMLLTGSLETAQLCHRRIVQAVTNGTLAREQVEAAVVRVLTLKQKLRLADEINTVVVN